MIAMINSKQIFKKGSKTYYYSSFFFDEPTKNNVTKLYSFVRIVDDFVDFIPSKRKEYFSFKKNYYAFLKGEDISSKYENVISEFVVLSKKFKFEQKWIDSFFYSMELDLSKKKCSSYSDTEKYMYGSAEVIGLMMSRILSIDKKSDLYSRKLGQSMQYINFIRDIKEDFDLQRIYLPSLYQNNIFNSKNAVISENKKATEILIRREIVKYYSLQAAAEKGFKYIPKRYRVAILTASDMYKWTAKKIYKDPLIIFQKKVKPSILRIIFDGIKNYFRVYLFDKN